MTWKNRWPTAEEARAHAERYGGRWLYRLRPQEAPRLILHIFVIKDEVYEVEAPHRTSTARRCADANCTPWLRPIDPDGNPVPWPGGITARYEALVKRMREYADDYERSSDGARGELARFRRGTAQILRELIAVAEGGSKEGGGA